MRPHKVFIFVTEIVLFPSWLYFIGQIQTFMNLLISLFYETSLQTWCMHDTWFQQALGGEKKSK